MNLVSRKGDRQLQESVKCSTDLFGEPCGSDARAGLGLLLAGLVIRHAELPARQQVDGGPP